MQLLRLHVIRVNYGTNHYFLLLLLLPPPPSTLLLTWVYPKYSGLVLSSIQQLWQHEAPVDGRTTMSCESVCQVARSWVDLGSFHTHLVVRFVISTASVQNILDTPSYLC
jgi:hypothetical protein